MKVKYIVSIILVLVLGGLVYYRINQNKKSQLKEGKSIALKALRVNGIVILPRHFSDALAVSGSIEPNEQVQIRSQVVGVILKISFSEGSGVQAGQELLRIDDTELQAQLSQALTRQHLAEENEKRANLLLKREGISQQEYDMTLADLKTFEAQTSLIRAQLAKTVIKAPFGGVIGLRKASVGEYLTPDLVVANLVDLNPLKVTFSVPEKYGSIMKVGTDLKFSIAGSGQKYKAKVYAIEPSIDPITRTLQLRAKADNSDGSILPGSFATIELPLTILKDAILVPTEAVVPVQNGRKVFIVENGKAKEVMVKASSRTAKDLLITAGLKKGDTVLVTGVMSLREGMPVVVRLAADSTSQQP